MGNKLGKRRQVVDEKYTKPQGLYPIKDVDYKKLRKLILESKLAPCYPGDDDCDCSLLEECPICFLHYPTLNRSRCCMKSICTECFLQMKNPNSTRPTQCPFCKTSNYAVEYRGVKSKEERGLEQIEEQKVIEVKIRMQQQQIQEEEEKMHKRQEMSTSVGVIHTENLECSTSRVLEGEAISSSEESNSSPLNRQSLSIRQDRDGEFDLDLEDIMVMEAIWLSIQEKEREKGLSFEHAAAEHYASLMTTAAAAAPSGPSTSSSSPSGGLACAIAALAERQQTSGEHSGNYSGNAYASEMLASSSRGPIRTKKLKASYASRANSLEDSNTERMSMMSEVGDWGSVDHGSVVAEAGTSCTTSQDSDDEGEAMPPPPPYPVPQSLYGTSHTSYGNPYGAEGGQGYDGHLQQAYVGGESYHEPVAGAIVPESFEEQMMLAMAVSLAEARARTSAQGLAWH